MYITLDIFLFFFSIMLLFTAVLSVTTGIVGFGWTISYRVVHMDVDFWGFSNNPTNFASVADAIILLIILHSTYMGPFYGVIYVIGVLLLGFGLRKKYPPDLMRAFGYEM